MAATHGWENLDLFQSTLQDKVKLTNIRLGAGAPYIWSLGLQGQGPPLAECGCQQTAALGHMVKQVLVPQSPFSGTVFWSSEVEVNR